MARALRASFTLDDMVSQMARSSATGAQALYRKTLPLFVARSDLLPQVCRGVPWSHAMALLHAATYAHDVPPDAYQAAMHRILDGQAQGRSVDWRASLKLLAAAAQGVGRDLLPSTYANAVRALVPQRRWAEAIAVAKFADVNQCGSGALRNNAALAACTGSTWALAVALLQTAHGATPIAAVSRTAAVLCSVAPQEQRCRIAAHFDVVPPRAVAALEEHQIDSPSSAIAAIQAMERFPCATVDRVAPWLLYTEVRSELALKAAVLGAADAARRIAAPIVDALPGPPASAIFAATIAANDLGAAAEFYAALSPAARRHLPRPAADAFVRACSAPGQQVCWSRAAALFVDARLPDSTRGGRLELSAASLWLLMSLALEQGSPRGALVLVTRARGVAALDVELADELDALLFCAIHRRFDEASAVFETAVARWGREAASALAVPFWAVADRCGARALAVDVVRRNYGFPR